MASIIAFLQANYLQIIVALLAVDKVLIGIFPSVALLGSIGSVLSGLVGGSAPAVKK